MKNCIYHIILMIVLLFPATIQAQDNASFRQIYSQAESEYQIGRLDQAKVLLNLSKAETLMVA